MQKFLLNFPGYAKIKIQKETGGSPVKKAWYWFFALAGCGIFVFAAVMFVSAIRFMELGRVLLYFLIGTAACELAVFSIIRLVKKGE